MSHVSPRIVPLYAKDAKLYAKDGKQGRRAQMAQVRPVREAVQVLASDVAVLLRALSRWVWP
jgi:hypothetical protein